MRTLVAALVLCASGLAARAAPGDGGGDGGELADAPSVADVEASAQSLSLADVFAVAVRVAPQLETAAFSLEQAQAQYIAAKGPLDFAILAELQYARDDGAPPDPDLAGSRSQTKQASIAVRKLLPTNGTLELIGATSEYTSDASGADRETIDSSISLRLDQPLLAGFGPAAAYRTTEQARLHRDAAVVRREHEARSYAVAVVEAYWNLSLAWTTLEVRRASLVLAHKQQALTEGAVRTGKLARSELLPVEQAIATRQQDILSAELDVVDQSIALRKLAGLEIDPAVLAVKTAALPAPEPVELDLAQVVAKAIASSDELKAAELEARSGAAAAAGSKRDYLPRADLRIEAGVLGSDSVDGTAASVRRAFGALDDGGYRIDATLSLELPIGLHAARGAYLADRASAKDLAFQVGVTRASIAGDVARVVYAVKTALLNARLGARAIELAEDSVEAEQKKFEVGKSTSAEIIRRQDELEAARLRAAIAVADYHIARARLEAATGDILATFGLRMLEPARRSSR